MLYGGTKGGNKRNGPERAIGSDFPLSLTSRPAPMAISQLGLAEQLFQLFPSIPNIDKYLCSIQDGDITFLFFDAIARR